MCLAEATEPKLAASGRADGDGCCFTATRDDRRTSKGGFWAPHDAQSPHPHQAPLSPHPENADENTIGQAGLQEGV